MSGNTDWFLFSSSGGVETWHRYERTPDGVQKLHVRQTWNPEWMQATLDRAAAERLANAGKRWGDGQVVGRLPLPLYFSSGMAQARLQKDDKWVKKFWNDPDVKKLRTFEGNV